MKNFFFVILALMAALALAFAHPTGEENVSEGSEAGSGKAEELAVDADKTKAEGAAEKVAEAAALKEAPKDETAEGEKCLPGETYKKDCNTCVCPPSGSRSLAACTLKLCLPHRE